MSLFPRFTQEFSPLFRLLDDYDRQSLRHFNKAIQTWSPKFDVKETKDVYELHGEFPGLERKDINIEWNGENTLTVSGRTETVREEGERPQIEEAEATKAIGDSKHTEAEKEAEHYHKPTVEDENEAGNSQVTKSASKGEVSKATDSPTHKYWVSERSVGEFHRSFNFPGRIDQDNVKASLKNGVLSIIVPKKKAVQPKKVRVE